MRKLIWILSILIFIISVNGAECGSNSQDITINITDPIYARYELIWEKNLGAKVLDLDISSNGKIIAVVYGIVHSEEDTTVTQIMNDAGESLWSTDNPTIIEISLSPEGNCLAMPDYKGDFYLYPDSLPTRKEKTIGGAFSDVSSNCELISIYHERRIFLKNREGKELWNFQNNDVQNLNRIQITNDGNYILVSMYGRLFFMDKNGKLIWQKEIIDNHVPSSISPGGKYIAAISDISIPNHYYIFIYNNHGNTLRKYEVESPWYFDIGRIFISDSGIIAAYAMENQVSKSSVILINSSGSLLWRREFDHQITAMAISDFGSHLVIGTENGDLYYFVRPDIEKTMEIEQEIEKENPINPVLIIIGLISAGIISIIISYLFS